MEPTYLEVLGIILGVAVITQTALTVAGRAAIKINRWLKSTNVFG